MLALRDLQTRFFRALAAAPGFSPGGSVDPELLRALEGRGRLGPAERLDVYAQMYWARLQDVLRDDFSRTAALLGAERFGTLALRYLAAHPSEHPSVRHVGRRFADFLGTVPSVGGVDFAFLADLARLEWARLEVFDAPDAEPLCADDLRRVPPADWPQIGFELIPAIVLLRSAWPVHHVWASEEARPVVPLVPAPAETHLRVWRDGFMIYQASMPASEQAAITCVIQGASFATICEAMVAFVGADQAPGEAASIVLRWTEDRVLSRVRVG